MCFEIYIVVLSVKLHMRVQHYSACAVEEKVLLLYIPLVTEGNQRSGVSSRLNNKMFVY